MDRESVERARRIDRLAQDLDLLRACARACEDAGLPPGRGQAVAYCLVALADKDARNPAAARDVPLDVEAPDAAQRVAHWARIVAANLRDGQELHETILREARTYRPTQLLREVGRFVPRRQDDVIETIADIVFDILDETEPIEAMTLEAARTAPLQRNAYVFRQPLRAWIGTVAKRRTPVRAGLLPSEVPARGGVENAIGEEQASALAELIEQVAAMDKARLVLADALTVTGGLTRALAQTLPADDAAEAALARILAALKDVGGSLAGERAALPDMLAYIMLGVRDAQVMQRVAVLSLRQESIDRAVVDDLAERMRATLDDDAQPTRRLTDRTEHACPPLSRSRVEALVTLRGASADDRRRALAPVAERLGGLPPTVADLHAVAAVAGVRYSATTTHRANVSVELREIDADADRVYRRYAFGERA